MKTKSCYRKQLRSTITFAFGMLVGLFATHGWHDAIEPLDTIEHLMMLGITTFAYFMTIQASVTKKRVSE